MRRLLHPFVIMPTIAAIAVGVWWFAIRDEPASTVGATQTIPTSQIVDVTQGSMNETVSAEGTVAAAETADLSFTVSGTVTAVNVAAGDSVTAGQVLATIDSSELAAAVTSAESTVADAKAKLADDQDADASEEQIAADIASIASANDALASAQDSLEGASLVATFDGTVSTVDLVVGEVLSSGGTGGTSLTGSGTGSGRSSSSGSSNDNGLIPSQSSTSSTDSTAQIQVVSSGRFEVEVSVDSADIESVVVGQEANVAVTTSSSNRRGFGGVPGGGSGGFPGGGAFPTGGAASDGITSGAAGGQTGRTGTGGTATGTATGTVASVSQVADASSGVASYSVTVSFEADADQFYVGSSVTAEIVIAERADVVQVPTRAITTTDSGSTVSVSTDGTADSTETRTVTIGLSANGQTEIVSGLAAGEKVVVSFARPGGTAAGGAPGGAVPTSAATQ